MEISVTSNHIQITGNIKTVDDFQNIKRVFDNLISQNKSLVVNIPDSLSITSSVIGYFNKLVLKDGIELRLKIGNEELLSLLDDLGLTSTLKATRA
ncbi:MAG: hypothetical protein QG559_976 [Campylobacterota bacterium]|nr:hypothetical protein [Campylobacterota bacterium]